jgi:redox-sensitive bicupin YhaK (pirin superfamily)
MKSIFHSAAERGHANHGWLDSYHSFSFAGFHDPNKVHFGALRVLNDDTVKGGYGFSKHPHDNMEIVSIPLVGDLHHQDTTGRDKIIKQGDVQIMSAGSGIAHSETNANSDKEVKFLQIWVFPKEKDIEPRYDQKSFPAEGRKNQLQIVVAPDDEQAVWINQQAWFTLGSLEQGAATNYNIKQNGNGVYAFLIEGSATVNGIALNRRDAVGIWETDTLNIEATSNAELLLIDVPMSL